MDWTKKVNWKQVGAAITGGLTILAVAPYQLGQLGTVISPHLKQDIAVAGLVATFLLKVWDAATKPQPPQP